MVSAEEGEHVIVAQYLDMLGLCWFHAPNGGHRNTWTGARLKRMGVKPGVPDFLIFDPPPGVPDARGVAIELKVRTGRLTPPQARWLEDLQDRQWLAMVAIGATDAIRRIDACGYRGVR